MENNQEAIIDTGIEQSIIMSEALNTFFTNYITTSSGQLVNDGVVILGIAKFAGYFIGKLSGLYHNTPNKPITEFEDYFRKYAEKSEQIFLDNQKKASEGEE